ncbi:unnamed protein product [Pieris macdunnoughi]|uniref:FLYWCH-type domain-containing protein n=1 Tax=Pieris macdunnoughi TaxID=345717 RepID=A0A821Q494_9NEOP|nr:unnamed protein product [Pieris macdunnoughi]
MRSKLSRMRPKNTNTSLYFSIVTQEVCHFHASVREITLLNGKKYLMINGYTFSWKSNCKLGKRYVCTLRTSFITLTTGRKQLLYKGYTFYQTYSGKSRHRWVCTLHPKFEFIETVNGKKYLKYNHHYYVLSGTKGRWRCNETSTCFTSLYVDEYLRPIKLNKPHDHPPARFIKTSAGFIRYRRDRRKRLKSFSLFSLSVKVRSRRDAKRQMSMDRLLDKKVEIRNKTKDERMSYYQLKKITLQNGKTYYLYKGYTYSLIPGSATYGTRWRCTKNSKCYVCMMVGHDGEILKIKGTYIWTKRGGRHPLLLLYGFTYSFQKKNADGRISWYCSRRLRGCRAAAVSFGQKAIPIKQHDHVPPKLPVDYTETQIFPSNEFFKYQ